MHETRDEVKATPNPQKGGFGVWLGGEGKLTGKRKTTFLLS